MAPDLRHDRARLMLAQLVNSAGETLSSIALTIYLFGVTRSFWAVGILLACYTVPPMLWSGRASRLVERYPLRRVAVVSLVALAVLLAVTAAVPSQTVLLLALVVGISSFYTVSDAALFAYIPLSSGDAAGRRRLQADMSALRWVAAAVGAALGGVLTARYGYQLPVLLDGASYLVAGLIIAGMSTGRDLPPPEEDEDDEDAAGVSRLAVLRRHPRILSGIVVLGASIVFLGATELLMIGFLAQAYADDGTLYGAVTSTYNWGILAGIVIGRVLSSRLVPMRTLVAACGLNGLLSVVETAVLRVPVTFGCNALSGVTHGLDSLAMRSMILDEVDGRDLSRVFSAFYAAAAGCELASFVLGSALGAVMPARWAIALCGAATVAVAAGAVITLRRVAARPPV